MSPEAPCWKLQVRRLVELGQGAGAGRGLVVKRRCDDQVPAACRPARSGAGMLSASISISVSISRRRQLHLWTGVALPTGGSRAVVGRKAGVQPERRRATVLWVGHLDLSRQAIYQLLHLVRVRVEGLGLGWWG